MRTFVKPLVVLALGGWMAAAAAAPAPRPRGFMC